MKHFYTFKFLLVAGIAAIFSFQATAQGPGGIGDGAGTNGPRNVLWLDATSLSALSNGATVSTWTDKSGNGNNLGQLGAESTTNLSK